MGLSLGSFSSAVTHRELLGKPWWSVEKDSKQRRSQCPSCNATLQAIDLIPLFSWVMLRGACRYCGKEIGWRYPLVELISGVFCALIGWYFHLAFQGFTACLLVPFLISFFMVFFQNKIVSIRLLLIISGLFLSLIVVTFVT